jgi:hypothetical protein
VEKVCLSSSPKWKVVYTLYLAVRGVVEIHLGIDWCFPIALIVAECDTGDDVAVSVIDGVVEANHNYTSHNN